MDLITHVKNALNAQYKKVFDVELSGGVANEIAMVAISAIRHYEDINKGNKQMTRAEALKRVKIIELHAGWSPGSGLAIIDCLQTLNLIKFDEEKIRPELHPSIKSCGVTHDIVDALFSKGYCIKKIGVDHV